MRDAEFNWRIERVCLSAWPAVGEVEAGDWLVRGSGGTTRRINSANPLRDPVCGIDAGIDVCEALYSVCGTSAMFRLPSFINPEVDATLQQRGYEAEGETCTLFGEIGTVAPVSGGPIERLSQPSAEWLAAMNRCQNHSGEQKEVYAGIVASIAMPACFAACRADGELVSLAIGVIRDGLICFESVVTDARYRGRGFARCVLEDLFAWAAAHGADGACLQVVATNTPALRLYRGLGLDKEVYRYHYRLQAMPD